MIIYQCDMCGCHSPHEMPVYKIKFADYNSTTQYHEDRKMICYQCGKKLIDLFNQKLQLVKLRMKD